jgi:hypothetical protein
MNSTTTLADRNATKARLADLQAQMGAAAEAWQAARHDPSWVPSGHAEYVAYRASVRAHEETINALHREIQEVRTALGTRATFTLIRCSMEGNEPAEVLARGLTDAEAQGRMQQGEGWFDAAVEER